MAFRHVRTFSNYSEDVPDGYCVHGTYVGGCGIDWMCGHCEMDEFDYAEQDMGTVHVHCVNAETGKVIEWNDQWQRIELAEETAKNWEKTLSGHVADLKVTIVPSVRGVWYNKRNEDGE
jgi:hypothetical protein